MKSIVHKDALMAVVEGLSQIFGKVSLSAGLSHLSPDLFPVMFNALLTSAPFPQYMTRFAMALAALLTVVEPLEVHRHHPSTQYLRL